MATATRKAGAAGQPARRARNVRVPDSIRFVIFEGNGGAYRSTLVGGDAATLAQSGSFATYDGAELAGRRVRDGAASARFDRRAEGAGRVDLAARRGRPSDDLDAERWLDEGRGASSETVARWQAHR